MAKYRKKPVVIESVVVKRKPPGTPGRKSAYTDEELEQMIVQISRDREAAGKPPPKVNEMKALCRTCKERITPIRRKLILAGRIAGKIRSPRKESRCGLAPRPRPRPVPKRNYEPWVDGDTETRAAVTAKSRAITQVLKDRPVLSEEPPDSHPSIPIVREHLSRERSLRLWAVREAE